MPSRPPTSSRLPGTSASSRRRRRRRRPASSSSSSRPSSSRLLYLNSGITGTPRIDDPQFIPQIVFDQTRGVNQPKARFAYLFPTANSALIQVRLKANLSDAQQAQAISWIRQAVKMPMFRSQYGGTYTVTGEPVVVNDLASQITGSILGLLIAALLVMAAMLLIVFRRRPRLLPLAIALAATGITFGLLSLIGGTLTMASIAVLPILIGLAVDYAIQFQSRVAEARQRRRRRGRRGSGGAVGRADDRDRRAGDGDRLPRAAALAGADGPRLWPAARGRDRGRACMRADGRVGRDRAPRPRWRRARRLVARRRRDPPRSRRADSPARQAPGVVACHERPAHKAAPAHGGAAAHGDAGAAPERGVASGARAGDRRSAGSAGLGRGHPDRGPVGRHQARAVEHAGAAQPPRRSSGLPECPGRSTSPSTRRTWRRRRRSAG